MQLPLGVLAVLRICAMCVIFCHWLCCQQVQHNWMYLENIFIGSEDIRKQLPQESLMFESVHHAFMRSMVWLHSVGNVVKATTGQGVLAAFQVRGDCQNNAAQLDRHDVGRITPTVQIAQPSIVKFTAVRCMVHLSLMPI